MSDFIKNCTKKIGETFIDKCLENFFQGVTEKVGQYVYGENQKQRAAVGSSEESVLARLDTLMEAYCDEITEKDAYYSEEELQEKFNRYYKEYLCAGQQIPEDEERIEELYKRFKLFITGYAKKLSKNISFGEKRILEKQERLEIALGELKQNSLSKEYFSEISKEQTELLNKLCQDMDIPFMEICSNVNAEWTDYHSRFAFLGNVFAFDKSEHYDRRDSFVLTFTLKNIGRSIINEIWISEVELDFCKEEYEDNPERAYLILPVTEYADVEKCYLNVLPGGEQKIHLLLRSREYELNDEEVCENFLEGYEGYFIPEFDYDRLFLRFCITLVGKEKSNQYEVKLFLTKTNHLGEKEMQGSFSIDFAGMKLAEITSTP